MGTAGAKLAPALIGGPELALQERGSGPTHPEVLRLGVRLRGMKHEGEYLQHAFRMTIKLPNTYT